jgi:hypothetical protein
MKLAAAVAFVTLAVAGPSLADPIEAQTRLMALPRADITRLVGSWEVEEMKPISMIYEFQAATMAMHGRNDQGGATFELLLDADYRLAGDDAVWVIGTHPRPVPDGTEENANNPSIMGVKFTTPDHATLTVSAGESFTLVRMHADAADK